MEAGVRILSGKSHSPRSSRQLKQIQILSTDRVERVVNSAGLELSACKLPALRGEVKEEGMSTRVRKLGYESSESEQ